jgi:hypothetical protein
VLKYLLAVSIIAGATWLMRRASRGPADDRFSIEGGRGGVIRFRDGEREAELSFEMGGSGLDVFLADSGWVAPERKAFSRADAAYVVSALMTGAGARGIAINVEGG